MSEYVPHSELSPSATFDSEQARFFLLLSKRAIEDGAELQFDARIDVIGLAAVDIALSGSIEPISFWDAYQNAASREHHPSPISQTQIDAMADYSNQVYSDTLLN
ncbi:MAG: hypothetical protein NVS1B10_00340 [Candidatus Saccharimonadales bacterium]